MVISLKITQLGLAEIVLGAIFQRASNKSSKNGSAKHIYNSHISVFAIPSYPSLG
jgi:hypothetical protein